MNLWEKNEGKALALTYLKERGFDDEVINGKMNDYDWLHLHHEDFTGQYGFKNRIRRGWRITKLGIHVVKADPELILYVLFSAIMSILSFGAVLTLTGGLGFVIGNDEGFEGGVALGTFLSYFIVSIIVVFWNAAIVASAYESRIVLTYVVLCPII